MDNLVLLYTSDKDSPSELVTELGISHGTIKELLVVSAAAFRVTYCSAMNKGVFDADTSQQIKKADRVYAALLSSDAKFVAMNQIVTQGWRVICAETQIRWIAIKQIHELSVPYANLLRQLDVTEEKCMATNRNDIRRRELQESYEYLDREIARLDDLLKQIQLTDG
ncbi:MAG: hypothetical protein OEZ09_07570 [Betaproteobacteria bacterium]|nr:hypothetical protein [Betaproteobacteria bacterium]MDH5578305.1 hypothetical protein [Betaproteobacteria bacterium]